jgi:(5-formylfuran-3-yl)methyl phosphate synthase
MSSRTARAGLLVSVRSAHEARAALAGGADLIDVKEPTRGPLGRADLDVVQSVVDEVGDRVPVSAALGEWRDWPFGMYPRNVTYIKWGLSQMANALDLAVFRVAGTLCGPKPVLVAYADHDRAESPLPSLLARRACEHHFSTFLLDTAVKDGSSLLDWIDPATLARIRFELADAGIRVAFAGSLNIEEIRRLLPLAPDWFAVRGAACVGGRDGSISTERVREIKDVIVGADSATTR